VPAFERLVIVSTGLADPFPILSTLRADPVLSHHLAPGTIVATVDAFNAADQIAPAGNDQADFGRRPDRRDEGRPRDAGEVLTSLR